MKPSKGIESIIFDGVVMIMEGLLSKEVTFEQRPKSSE